MKKLELFSVHYRGDQNDGINFMFLGSNYQQSAIVGFTAQKAFEICLDSHNKFLAVYEKKGERMLNRLQRQLDYWSWKYHKKLSKSTKIKTKKIGFEYYGNDEALGKLILLIMINIYTLTIMGRIKNDTFNGTNFGYRY